MNFNVTAGVPKTVFLVSIPAGAKVTDITYTYDDNGTNVGSFHPADDNLSGVFLGTGEGSATVTVNCKSVGGVDLSNASVFTIAAAPPIEATGVELRDAA